MITHDESGFGHSDALQCRHCGGFPHRDCVPRATYEALRERIETLPIHHWPGHLPYVYTHDLRAALADTAPEVIR